MEVNTTQMLDTLALGEKVKKDPKLTQKRKDEVAEHLNSLTARWDRVKDFVALRKERYATHTGVCPYLIVVATCTTHLYCLFDTGLYRLLLCFISFPDTAGLELVLLANHYF